MELAAERDPGRDAGQDDGVAAAAKQHLLAELGDRVAPIVMAHERTLPVPEPLSSLFPSGGMVRGRAVSCGGAAATSLALSLVAPSIVAGSWLAVVDLPALGLDAASEAGIPLERVVGIELGDHAEPRWADVVAAAADGFDVVLTRIPAAIRPVTARAVATRLHQRGAVLVAVGDTGVFRCDVALGSSEPAWEGIGDGFGHLRARSVLIDASGRRVQQGRRCRLALPAVPGVAPAAGDAGAVDGAGDAGDGEDLGVAPAVGDAGAVDGAGDADGAEEDHGTEFVLAG